MFTTKATSTTLSRYFFVLLFLLYAWIALDYTWKLQVWSPLDEIAHYDYIVKLAAGHFPAPTEPIDANLARLTISRLNWIPAPDFSGTPESMGLSGLSYEAQQPPVYYLLMAMPYRLLSLFVADPLNTIRLMRVLGVISQIAAAILLGICLAKCSLFMSIHPIWPNILPVLSLLPGWGWRATIGNGNLTFLVVTLACLFLINHLAERQTIRYAFLCVLFTVLAFLTKYTCLLLMPLMISVILWKSIRHHGRLNRLPWRSLAVVFSPLVLIAVYLLFNGLRFGFDDLLGTKSVSAMFAPQVDMVVWGFGLLKLLVSTAIDIPYLNFMEVGLPLFAIACSLTGITYGWEFLRTRKPSGFVPLIGVGMVVLLMVSAWLLTKLNPDVDWGFFRHYSGFLGFWLIAMTGFAYRPGRVQRTVTWVLGVALLIPIWIYFA